MMIGFAALGSARTTRQGRGKAMASAIVAIVALRIVIFGISSLIVRSPWAVPLAYLVPLGVTVVAAFVAFRFTWLSGFVKSRRLRLQGPLRAAPAS